jgi:hypothetical protein
MTYLNCLTATHRTSPYLTSTVLTPTALTFWLPRCTGFFIKGTNGYIFVTAKHAISGISTFSGIPDKQQFDSLGIRYFTKNGDSIKYIYLNVSEWKKRIANKPFYELPDVIGFKINDFPDDAKINSIENILRQGPPTDTPYKVVIYGYAVDSLTPKNYDTDYFPLRKYECTLADSNHIDPYYPTDTLNTVLMPAATYGISGAPVFYIYKRTINGPIETVVKFGGVEIGNNRVYNCTYAVKSKIVIAELKRPTIYK